MKLTSVELHPAQSSNVAVLSFRDPRRENPYNVKAIIGLDADEIIPRYYGGSGATKFYNLSLEKREIVVRIALNPNFGLDQTFSNLRDGMYKLIASSRTGQLELKFKYESKILATISGFVTKIETPHFNKEQEVQLTISCDEPMLKAPARVSVGSLNTTLTTVKDKLSTAPHGFIFELLFSADTPFQLIEDPNDLTWGFSVYPAGGFLVGDVLHFSSEYNNKYLYMVREGDTYYLADVITPGSIWPILFPGDTTFALSNPSNVSWVSLQHYPTYWGV